MWVWVVRVCLACARNTCSVKMAVGLCADGPAVPLKSAGASILELPLPWKTR